MPKSKRRFNRPTAQKKPKNVKREEFYQALTKINAHMILADGRRNTQFRELASIILEMLGAHVREDNQASYEEAEKKLVEFIKGRDESLERLTHATIEQHQEEEEAIDAKSGDEIQADSRAEEADENYGGNAGCDEGDTIEPVEGDGEDQRNPLPGSEQ